MLYVIHQGIVRAIISHGMCIINIFIIMCCWFTETHSGRQYLTHWQPSHNELLGLNLYKGWSKTPIKRLSPHHNITANASCITTAKGKNKFHKITANGKVCLNCQSVFNSPWRAMTVTRNSWSCPADLRRALC